jgi:hypothetical protein
MSQPERGAAIHVEPHYGRWAVRHSAHAIPLSVHDDAGAATRAAHAHAGRHLQVVLRDLYGRVHELTHTEAR